MSIQWNNRRKDRYKEVSIRMIIDASFFEGMMSR